MGLYDTFGKKEVQLKVGVNELRHYSVGNNVPIEDGVYVGYEGVIVIKDGVFIAEFDCITDKYGCALDNKDVFHNPLQDVVKQIVDEIESDK